MNNQEIVSMTQLRQLAAIALAAVAFSACDDDTLSIGSSLTNENDLLSFTSATFKASTRNFVADSVYVRSSDCWLGMVKDPETGAVVSSEFTTQFNLLPMNASTIGPYDGRDCDSCDMVLYITEPFKAQDSLTAMKMRVMELAKPVRETEDINFSSYDPTPLVRTGRGAIAKGKTFTYHNLLDTDSARQSSSYLQNIRISMNDPYYDSRRDTTYNNYGSYIMHNYYKHPELFRNAFVFADSICPGFYFKMTDGLGFYAKVANVGLRLYYQIAEQDTVYNSGLVLAGTKEVLQTAKVSNDFNALRALQQESRFTYLKSPAGLFTEVILPVKEIMENHENDSVLAAKIVFQRLNEQTSDQRVFGIPQKLLMVQKEGIDSVGAEGKHYRDNYFKNGQLPDSRNSYYTAYASSTNTYTFNNISDLIMGLWKKRCAAADPQQWEREHPDWNHVLLVPVDYTTSSSSANLTSVKHDMSLTSARLVGGSDNPDAISISVVYAKFKNQ